MSFLGSTWVVEQPMTSLLWEHPRMRWLLTTVKARDAASCIFLPSAHPVLDSAPVPRPAGDCSRVPRPPEAHKHFLWLGTWGGISPKPTHLVSNSQLIVGLGARGARLRGAAAVGVPPLPDRQTLHRQIRRAALRGHQAAEADPAPGSTAPIRPRS